MIYIGIDPGLTGGVAALDAAGNVVMADAMPTEPSFLHGRNMACARELAAMLRGVQQQDRVLCAVEQVGAMPKNGAVSMFGFGQAFGTILGVAGAIGLGYVLVKPPAWKRFHGLVDADKAQSIGLVMRRWPDLHLKKKDDGIAEALLIADYLRRREQPTS